MQVVPTLEATNPAIRTWRQTDEGGPTSLPTSVIYMDLPVRASPCHSAHVSLNCLESLWLLIISISFNPDRSA